MGGFEKQRTPIAAGFVSWKAPNKNWMRTGVHTPMTNRKPPNGIQVPEIQDPKMEVR